jgi:hypothetical protein
MTTTHTLETAEVDLAYDVGTARCPPPMDARRWS